MRLSYVWDYDIDAAQLADILVGRATLGRLNRDWAAVRLLEYAPYPEIVKVLGYRARLEGKGRIIEIARREGRKIIAPAVA